MISVFYKNGKNLNLRETIISVAKSIIYLLTPIEPTSIIGKSFSLNKEDDPKIKRYLYDSALREYVYSSMAKPKGNAINTDGGLILDIEYHTNDVLGVFRFKVLTAYGTRYIEWFDLFERDIVGNFHLKENVLIE